MRRLVLAIVLSGLVTGCAGGLPFFTKEAETIKVPVQQARNLYATIRTHYLDLKAWADGKCQRNEFTAADCLKMATAHAEFKELDFEIRRALDNPGVDMNWKNIEKVISLAGALKP